jgi:hypothetical protein
MRAAPGRRSSFVVRASARALGSVLPPSGGPRRRARLYSRPSSEFASRVRLSQAHRKPPLGGRKTHRGTRGVLDSRNGWGVSPDIAGSDGAKWHSRPSSPCPPRPLTLNPAVHPHPFRHRIIVNTARRVAGSHGLPSHAFDLDARHDMRAVTSSRKSHAYQSCFRSRLSHASLVPWKSDQG